MHFLKALFKKTKRIKPSGYVYEELPEKFLIQVVQIWIESIGPFARERTTGYRAAGPIGNPTSWVSIHKQICKEIGVFHLGKSHEDDLAQVANFFLRETDIKILLRIIEITFHYIDTEMRKKSTFDWPNLGIQTSASLAIEDLNKKFKDHNLGYQYTNCIIIRIDSDFYHENIIQPSLNILRAEDFSGAEEELINAISHYNKGSYKECLNECLKSFESTIKTICDRKNWKYPPNVTSNGLVRIIFDNQLLSSELLAVFTGLRATLESGISSLRNKHSGHGQGSEPKKVPKHIATYGMHLTASSILLLVEAFLFEEGQ